VISRVVGGAVGFGANLAHCADDRLGERPRRALSVMKAQLNVSFERSFGDAVEAEAIGQYLAFRSKESPKGARAFLGKRAPIFRSC
jgi:2-(1,2-epoxy-1,2-dihydrophenyl)acetyl-CoA isomerase